MFAIQAPFPIFIDLNNFPLTAGYVYIGVVNEDPVTTPQTVYWDEAGAIPASQPISTLNGTFVHDGTPANIFVTDDYSITVKNKQGIIVFTEPQSFSNIAGLISQADYATRTSLDGSAGPQATIPTAQTFFRVQGYATPGDGGTGLYVEVADTGSIFPHQFRTNGNTRRWQYVPDGGTIRPEVVGLIGQSNDFATLVGVDISAAALRVDILLSARSDITPDHQFRSHVRFEGAGALYPVASANIDFLSGFTAAPDFKIFDLSNGTIGVATVLVDRITPNMFGAVGDNTTPSDDGFNQCIRTALAAGIEIHIPVGRYKFANALTVEINDSGGLIMRGLGDTANVILSFAGLTLTDAAFIIQDTMSIARRCDNVVLSNFKVLADNGNVSHRLGANDFTDTVFRPHYEDMIFANDIEADECIVLNNIKNGYFDIDVDGGQIGIALRNTNTSKFLGRAIGTSFAINFPNTAVFNTGNVFTGFELQSAICVGNQNADAMNNQFIGGLWTYSAFGYQDNAGSGNTINNPAVISSTKANFMSGNGTGVTVLHGSPTDFLPTAPAFAGFAINMTNNCGQSIDVEFIWAGGATITGFIRNGVTRNVNTAPGYLSFRANPGDVFQLLGSGTVPDMIWSN